MTAVEPEYLRAQAFYEGDVPEVITSRKLRRLLGSTARHFSVNYAATPVDVLAERTYIAGIRCEDAAVKELLDTVWEQNELGLEAPDLHLKAYEYGDAYLIGWPDPDAPGGVSLFAHDPLNVRVFYDPANPRRKSHAAHRWEEQGTDENGLGPGRWLRLNLYYPDRVEQWVSNRRIDVDLPEKPTLVALSEEPEIPNPTPGVIPVFHFRTRRPYGRPEHADAYGPQNMLNKLNVTMMGAVDHAGYPQRYVTTDAALDPSSPADAFSPLSPEDPDYDPTLPGLAEDSSLQSGPGETWILSGSDIKVGQFTVANTSNFLDAVHSLVKQMSSVCDIPAYYFDRSGQMPSGESFRRAEAPLDKKVKNRQMQLGVTWREVFQWVARVAKLGDRAFDADVTWAAPLVYTDPEAWETAQVQRDMGVPLQVIFEGLGYPTEQAADWAAQTTQPDEQAER